MDKDSDSNQLNRKFPFILEIHPTSKCNLNCPYCYFDHNEKDFISDVDLVNIINEILNSNIKYVRFCGGGEPLMRPGVFNYLLKKNKRSIHFSLTSNFSLLNIELITQFIKYRWDRFEVSLDGFEEVHDFVRNRKGLFKKIKENILLLNKISFKLRLKRPELIFHTVLNKYNFDKLESLIIFSEQCRVNFLSLWPVYIHEKNSFMKMERIDFERFNNINTRRYIPLLKRLEIENDFSPHIIDDTIKEKLINKNRTCKLPSFFLHISSNGRLGPCCGFAGNKVFPFFKNSIEESFNSLEYSIIKKKLMNGEGYGHCQDCPERYQQDLEKLYQSLT